MCLLYSRHNPATPRAPDDVICNIPLISGHLPFAEPPSLPSPSAGVVRPLLGVCRRMGLLSYLMTIGAIGVGLFALVSAAHAFACIEYTTASVRFVAKALRAQQTNRDCTTPVVSERQRVCPPAFEQPPAPTALLLGAARANPSLGMPALVVFRSLSPSPPLFSAHDAGVQTAGTTAVHCSREAYCI